MQRSFKILQCTPKWKPPILNVPFRSLASATNSPVKRPGVIDGLTFEDSFKAERPYVFSDPDTSPTYALPAFHKWFKKDEEKTAFASYIDSFHQLVFPYELIKPFFQGSETISRLYDSLLNSQDAVDRDWAVALQSAAASEASRDHQFFQLYAPLRLLVKALEFNEAQRIRADPPVQLYIAQSLLSDLPSSLQSDVPAPELIRKVGRGDIYSSSIWLGTEPTYTPLHRDPNPNLFCQLCSSKVVRLLPPKAGLEIYNNVQMRLRQSGNSRIRSTEMMEGEEREMLHGVVWEDKSAALDVQEVDLSAGDALFIPKGWWHSIKSKQSDGRLNGSVNWWFR
ncbi:uncharacterized protein TrAFT101_002848 [Trichoderma asperellum]|uniref:JmjC domain-containing protein n=1 Tax=Trichoderma asperellum (strain ATCC 204424 / CBS 433.97 / NBRC 101777) TaxID=1042311 RepID=A0A2T3ZHL0_TRIA4|nr:hypothetical protein M441DRAFT_133073 [Trichoderma asperellum CBS 433.97]PTB44288.1 hypothetical protein M441DRAFT_133073 [Trichoderma asperellum CBS 433.97]UKZ87034.1 hypothetical protein TrAFT101_002848 [Trichoderma asperellum]